MRTGIGNYRFNNQKGMSLVEVMVSLFIVSLAVLAMYIMFINGRMLIVEQQHRKVVIELARDRLESMQYAYAKLGTIPRHFTGGYEEEVVSGAEDRVPIFADVLVRVEHSRQVNLNTGMPYYSIVNLEYTWMEYSDREFGFDFFVIF